MGFEALIKYQDIYFIKTEVTKLINNTPSLLEDCIGNEREPEEPEFIHLNTVGSVSIAGKDLLGASDILIDNNKSFGRYITRLEKLSGSKRFQQGIITFEDNDQKFMPVLIELNKDCYPLLQHHDFPETEEICGLMLPIYEHLLINTNIKLSPELEAQCATLSQTK